MIRHIDYINGLRAVAIIGVLWEHLVFAHHRTGGAFSFQAGPIDLTFLAGSGWLGVNLFFFLSGFVLFLPYARGERTLDTGDDLVAYLKRRAGRLLPLYFLAGAVILALGYRHNIPTSETWLSQWPAFLTATYVFNPETFQPIFSFAFWSIAIEIWFSVVFPVFVVVARRFPLWAIVAGASALSIWLRMEGHKVVGSPLVSGHTDTLIHRLPDFLFGMLAASAFASGVGRAVLRSYATCVFGLACMGGAGWGFHEWSYGRLPLHVGAWAPIVLNAGLFCFCLFLLQRRPALFSPLTFAPVQVVGMMCYSLYIWHMPLMGGINLNTPSEWAEHWPAYALALIAVGVLSYRFVEFPGVSWRQLFLIPLPLRPSQSRSDGVTS